MNRSVICLDFDGVIHDPYDRLPGYRMGKPINGSRSGIETLLSLNAVVLVHTVRAPNREAAQHVYEWMAYFEYPQLLVLPTKPRADLYVDDQSWPMRFQGWFERTPYGMIEMAQENAERRTAKSNARRSS